MPAKPFDCPLGLHLWQYGIRTRRPRLREGYTFSPLEDCSDSYRFSVLPGAGKLNSIIRSFSAHLPGEAFLILEYYPDPKTNNGAEHPEPTVYYSPYLPTTELLEIIDPFIPRLIHDGFVGFGLANNRAGLELFYSEEKVLTCFTGNHIQFMDFLSRFELPYDPYLNFPTDFGHDHLSLLCHPRRNLPEPFCSMNDQDLDYLHFCQELVELLDMYPVEETLSFFLSKKEQDAIEGCLLQHPEFAEFAEEDFGTLLLDWNDFVAECDSGFEGDLWEYRQGLRLRDMIQHVVQSVSAALANKILGIITEADVKLRCNLIDCRKRLDPPSQIATCEEHFWYHGVVRNQGAFLRRDLIREGWFKP